MSNVISRSGVTWHSAVRNPDATPIPYHADRPREIPGPDGVRHVPVNHTVGPATLPKGATAEGSLDVQYIMGVSPFVPTVVWATAGQRFDPDDGKYDNEPFLKWIVNISAPAAEPIPHIFSLSYQDYEDTCAPAYMERLNTEFAALAMRGTTLVTGSGDWGTGCSKADNATFRADFPSSSPYVVSTGATTFPSGGGDVHGSDR